MSDEKQRFVEFSKPFVDNARSIFDTMVFTKITTGKPYIKTDSVSIGDISSTIGINGTVDRDGEELDFKGQFVITFPKPCYLKIAGAMLGEEYEDLNSEINDVGAEICNMIIGNTKRDLTQLGFKLNMAIPSTIIGKGHSIQYTDGVTIIVIPIACDHGEFYIEICYKDL